MSAYLLLLWLPWLQPVYGTIEFDQHRNYHEIWQSANISDAPIVSIWGSEPPEDYYLLGDTIVAGVKAPTRTAVFVKAAVSDSKGLAVPLDATEIWSDEGTARGGVVLFELVAPYGYQCIGAAAVSGYTSQPNLKKYRCIKEDYLLHGKGWLVWDDHNQSSSIYIRDSICVVGAEEDSGGLPNNNFVLCRDVKWVLNTTILMNAVRKEATLRVKEIGCSSKVWEPLNMNVGIYNPVISVSDKSDGFLILGSVLVASTQPPKQLYVVSGEFGVTLTYPLSYTPVWNDSHPVPLYLWRPHCHTDYVYTGLYATNSAAMPLNETVCVHRTFLSTRYNWWIFVRASPDFSTSLWVTAPIPDTLPPGSFTVTHLNSTFYPTMSSDLLSRTKMTLVRQFKLDSVVFQKADIVRTMNSPYRGLPSSFAYKNVTAKWTLKGATDPDTLLDISPIQRYPPNLGAIIKTVAEKVGYNDRYYSFTLKAVLPTPLSVITVYRRSYWVDIPFHGVLYHRDCNNKWASRVEGNLNMVLETFEWKGNEFPVPDD